jgi:hypothetical protein
MKQKRYLNRKLYGNIFIIVTTKRWAVLYKHCADLFPRPSWGRRQVKNPSSFTCPLYPASW